MLHTRYEQIAQTETKLNFERLCERSLIFQLGFVEENNNRADTIKKRLKRSKVQRERLNYHRQSRHEDAQNSCSQTVRTRFSGKREEWSFFIARAMRTFRSCWTAGINERLQSAHWPNEGTSLVWFPLHKELLKTYSPKTAIWKFSFKNFKKEIQANSK